jgi:hypothetical protein
MGTKVLLNVVADLINQAATEIEMCKVSSLPQIERKMKTKEPLPEKEVISMA